VRAFRNTSSKTKRPTTNGAKGCTTGHASAQDVTGLLLRRSRG